MTSNDIPWNPPPRVLRQFAVCWLVCLGVLAWRLGFPESRSPAAVAAALLAVTLGPLGLVFPSTIRWPFVGLTLVTLPIGWLVSNAVLGALFYGMFTPVALFFRARGRDALALQPRSDAATHWLPKPAAAHAGRYYQQF